MHARPEKQLKPMAEILAEIDDAIEREHARPPAPVRAPVYGQGQRKGIEGIIDAVLLHLAEEIAGVCKELEDSQQGLVEKAAAVKGGVGELFQVAALLREHVALSADLAQKIKRYAEVHE